MLLPLFYEVDLFLEEESTSPISLPNAFAKKKKFSIEASVYHSWNDESQLDSARMSFSSRSLRGLFDFFFSFERLWNFNSLPIKHRSTVQGREFPYRDPLLYHHFKCTLREDKGEPGKRSHHRLDLA